MQVDTPDPLAISQKEGAKEKEDNRKEHKLKLF